MRPVGIEPTTLGLEGLSDTDVIKDDDVRRIATTLA